MGPCSGCDGQQHYASTSFMLHTIGWDELRNGSEKCVVAFKERSTRASTEPSFAYYRYRQRLQCG